MDKVISFPFSNGLIRQHYHLPLEMMMLLTVDKLLSLVSPVQYCGLMWIVMQFTRHSVHRKCRCGVFCYVFTQLAPFSFVFLLTMCTSTLPKNLWISWITAMWHFYFEQDQMMCCLVRPWVELFQDFLLSWFCHHTLSCGISWKTLIKNKLHTFESLRRNITNEITAVCLA
jgi:hypothetical protein